MDYEWVIRTPSDMNIREYMRELNVSRILASGLIRNNVSIERARGIINIEDNQHIFNPLPIDNLDEAAALVYEYLKKPNAIIQIFGDYDTDGITSLTFLCKSLYRISDNICKDKAPRIGYYVPQRSEGYGLSVSFAENFSSYIENDEPEAEVLVITVDNGITAKPAIDILLKNPRIKVLVTDHHEPDFENNLTPTEDCICVDPKLRSHSPGELLAGCGVIFNLVQKLEDICEVGRIASSGLYYLIAIGTVGDMMEMDDYHAAIVNAGIVNLNVSNAVPWVRYLKQRAGISHITSRDIQFTISPFINSCGQMGDSSLPLRMILAENEEQMLELFEQAYRLYTTNKNESKNMREKAEVDILENYIDKHSFIMYPMQTNVPGFVSKVATHLAKKIATPIVLWAETDDNVDDEIIPGSARNDTTLPVMDIFKEAVRMGLAHSAEGHTFAFGVKLYRSKLAELQSFLDDRINNCGKTDRNTTRKIFIDGYVTTDDINVENMRDLEKFPFVKNLEAPIVMIKGAKIRKVKTSKSNSRNKCYTIQSPEATRPIDVWAWDIKPDEYQEGIHTTIDMVGEIDRNFMRPDYPTLRVIDLRCY